MHPSQLELAVLNNAHWYAAMFAAHGLASHTDELMWRSLEAPPPFHSNLVVISPAVTLADVQAFAVSLEQQPRPAGWSLKDSYACLDLAPLGFSQLFQAEWIWREALPAPTAPVNGRLTWTRLSHRDSLAEWERAWAGDTRNDTGSPPWRQFPDGLLRSAKHAFFEGRLDGQLLAGGIANQSPGVVGLSNIFSPPDLLSETWHALAACIAAAFPAVHIVGYERGPDLLAAEQAGFARIGPLRVWCR